MSREDFRDQYLDILQNIEFAVINVYREHPDLTDYNVKTVYDALIERYKADQRDKEPRKKRMVGIEENLYEAVKVWTDWRLGRDVNPDRDGRLPDVINPLTLQEMIDCLKYLKRSIRTWSKQGGRQGYLNYVEQFIV